MPVIGITGGIGTGKSLVARLFQERGATVFSADQAARAILTPGGRVLREIAREFGPDMLGPDGLLDRSRLGQRIFSDPDARQKLNSITHPAILRLLRAQIQAAQDDLPSGTMIVVEVPLLYEAHMQGWFDRVIVVSASEAVQIARLRQRDGLDEAEARRRLASQWPLARKIALADIVINNDDGLAKVTHEVAECWRRLQADFTPSKKCRKSR